MKTMLIAECGSCHDRRLHRAVALIQAAAAAGATVVKFQFWSDSSTLAVRRHAPELVEMYERYALPVQWLPLLRDEAHARGIEFACTSYLPQDVGTVAQYADLLKISSFEAQDPELLAAHVPAACAGKQIVVSLGMNASDGMIALNLDGPVLVASGRSFAADRLLCVSAYPAPHEELGLRELRHGMSTRAVFSGFSDHSLGTETWTGALAVAAGARIVERHIRLHDTDQANPDYPHAMPPALFAEYVEHIRYAERALGDGTCGVRPSEEPMLKYRVDVSLAG